MEQQEAEALERLVPAERDPFLQPFSSESPWNTPIGSDAQFVPAGLGNSYNYVALDLNYLIVASPGDQAVPVLRPGFPSRCDGTEPYVNTDGSPVLVALPFETLIEDVSETSTPDNNIAVLQPDGETVMEFSAAARCEEGGPLFGWHEATTDRGLERMVGRLSDDGLHLGANGGSGLTALGGAIRRHEIDGTHPIPHALRISLPVFDYSQAGGECRVWPALRHDAYACNEGSELDYIGPGPVTMGSLLALDPGLNVDEIGLELPFSVRIAKTLQTFGAYTAVTTSSYSPGRVQIAFEGIAAAPHFTSSVLAPIQEIADIPEIAPAWLRDWNRILPLLNVIQNNGPQSVGGGGTPLVNRPPALTSR